MGYKTDVHFHEYEFYSRTKIPKTFNTSRLADVSHFRSCIVQESGEAGMTPRRLPQFIDRESSSWASSKTNKGFYRQRLLTTPFQPAIGIQGSCLMKGMASQENESIEM